ncbi:MAG: UDP-N-acetylglucosamine 2-epimerase, partial [Burkholderiaceae bacterium]|nr:UDP-N-acetylglucosamine 2-epimerase [Burkholderiaceae bacterium]
AKTLRELGSGEGSGGSGSGSRGSEGGSRGSGRGSALPANLCLVDPQPYLEFNWLVKHARAVITDSGGITEETTVMGVPCLTLRDTTERPETITLGTNELIGTDPSRLKPALDRLFAGQWKKGAVPPLWDGRTGERIVGVLEGLAVDGRLGTLSVPG